VPPNNELRRRALTDAAIALLASDGVHGLTHRAVEKVAKVPVGTASNYFPTRESLLVAAGERVVGLHLAEMESASRDVSEPATRDTATGSCPGGTGPADAGPDDAGRDDVTTPARLVDLLAGSLLVAATGQRDRYRAIFELRLEAERRPVLALALSSLAESMQTQTRALHAELGTTVPDSAIRTMITLYGGILFTLVTTPPEEIDAAGVRDLAEAIVGGALGRHGRARTTGGGPTGRAARE